MKLLLIGGYPKGHERPFDLATYSGKRLRTLVKELGLDAIYLDLWQTGEEEKSSRIDEFCLSIVRHHISQGVKCIALGRRVQTSLLMHGIEVQYLPHPASRKLVDRQKLREGLKAFCV
jgi:hypothetical protein